MNSTRLTPARPHSRTPRAARSVRARALRFAGVAVATALCGLGLITARAVRAQRRTLHPPRLAVRRDAASELGEIADVAFVTGDGLTIRGWYHPSRNRAAVILGHGWGGTREQLLPEAEILARHGYGVLLFDWRAHGESDGDTCTWGDLERRDLIAAIDFVAARKDVDPDRLAALGFSIGGSVVIDVAAVDRRLKAVVVEGTTPSLAEEIDESLGRYRLLTGAPSRWAVWGEIDVDAVRPIDHVGEISPRPILVVCGDYGKDQPERLARRLFDAARDPKEYLYVPGAGHGEYARVAPAKLEERIIATFDGALLGAEPPGH